MIPTPLVQRGWRALALGARNFRVPMVVVSQLRSQTSERETSVARIVNTLKQDPSMIQDVVRDLSNSGDSSKEAVFVSLVSWLENKKFDLNADGVITTAELRRFFGLGHIHGPAGTVTESYVEAGVNKTVLNSIIEPTHAPSSSQLRRLAVASAVPFIGFGLLDNAIMLLCGNEIELYFGASLGLSSLAAAALGNTLSDVAGIQAGGIIESLASKLGLPDPDLSQKQLKMKISRYVTVFASMVGVAIGCLLGMFPLLWMKEEDDDERLIKELFHSSDIGDSGYVNNSKIRELICRALWSTHKNVEEEKVHSFIESLGLDTSHELSYNDFKKLLRAYQHITEVTQPHVKIGSVD